MNFQRNARMNMKNKKRERKIKLYLKQQHIKKWINKVSNTTKNITSLSNVLFAAAMQMKKYFIHLREAFVFFVHSNDSLCFYFIFFLSVCIFLPALSLRLVHSFIIFRMKITGYALFTLAMASAAEHTHTHTKSTHQRKAEREREGDWPSNVSTRQKIVRM